MDKPRIFAWVQEAIDNYVEPEVEPQYEPKIPLDPDCFAGQVNLVDSAQTAEEMAQVLAEVDVRWIGIDSEFRYKTPGVYIRADTWAQDCRSVQPLLLSLTAMEAVEGALRPLNFVVDVREGGVLDALSEVLRLPVRFVGHFLKVELFCLWKLGLEEPASLWDTWVAEKCRFLGRYNVNYNASSSATDGDLAGLSANADAAEQVRLSLTATCTRHAVDHRFALNKDQLQQSFIDFAGGPFSQDQINYAAEDAAAAALLYRSQVGAAAQDGLLQHLECIEMPWVAVNARVQWHGVKIDPDRRKRLFAACTDRTKELDQAIQAFGIENWRSHPQLVEFFTAEGVIDAFRKSGKITFGKDQLKQMSHVHPVVPLIRDARKIQTLERDKVLTPAFDGEDGRVHADHRHLGADSSRQSCRWPNLLGLDRTLRPLIVPTEGYGIGEVDLSQIEVGISGAVYGDEHLIEMFNSGDVYSSMAQKFFADDLSEEDLVMDSLAFKKKHGDKRSVMKTCTLGIIYGLTAYGLSAYLQCSKEQAESTQQRFMQLFPQLSFALSKGVTEGARRGWVSSVTGLKRYRARPGTPSPWERNWMRNHPVQASAADAFKLAGIRLDKLYRPYDARIILPVHDAYVFECPLDHLQAVAELTSRVMIEAVVELFPVLRPRTDINIEYPQSWNKDGQHDALEKWIETPVASLE